MGSRVEEMTAVAVAAPQARRLLMSFARFPEWVAPDITVTPLSVSTFLAPGDRFRMEPPGGFGFDYLVEAVTDRELVFSFSGPWSGQERWSFVADGEETIVRRVYDVTDGSILASVAWRAIGQMLVAAHFKLELSRFRAALERDPGPRAEIEPRPTAAPPEAIRPDAGRGAPFSFPVDEG
jgi:hypothetical protein